MTPEDIVKNSIMLRAGELGFVCLRLNSGRAWNGRVLSGRSITVLDARPIALCPEGTPDLLMVAPGGRAVFVETKVHPRKATDAQIRFIENAKRLGAVAGVCYSVEDFNNLIKELL